MGPVIRFALVWRIGPVVMTLSLACFLTINGCVFVIKDPPRQPQTAVPVPSEIKDQLLSTQDITGGAELQAQIIVLDAGEMRWLISGHGLTLCSPTGNCPRWIFRRTAHRYEQEVDLGEAQTVTIETGKAKYPEVFARQHGSATDSDLRVFQFDGTRYRLTKCMSESYRDPNDIDYTLEKPIVTEFHCGQ
jgi:hypothetical protein